jgi:serine protease Do
MLLNNKYMKPLLLLISWMIFSFSIQPAYCNYLIPSKEGFSDIVDKLSPAVVNVATKQKISFRNAKEKGWPSFPEGSPFEDFEEFFKRFGTPFEMDKDSPFQSRNAISLGSGFIIDPKGYIVTNNHVVAEADDIKVKLNGGEELKAIIIGTDPKTDLALIKVNTPKSLPYVSFGESDKVKVGEWAIAIGNPFGLGGTVTAGIISAHARDINFGGIVDEFIQTDASINKGSSGGPLFNIKGEVIGINTAIASSSFAGGNVGIGFAIPSSIAKPVIEQLKKGIKLQRGFLGVKIQDITEEIAESLGLKEQKGALVVETTKGGPADKSGIKAGDIIIEFDSKTINSARRLTRIVAETPVRKKVEVTLIGKNGIKKTLHVLIDEFKDSKVEDKDWDEHKNNGRNDESFLDIEGAKIAKLTSELRERYGIEKDVAGVIVLKVKFGSEWANLGIRDGDVIVEANQESINTPDELERIIKKQQGKSKNFLSLLINRNGQTIFLALQIYKE